jgi:DNA-binding NarL/FixJ family response regulator
MIRVMVVDDQELFRESLCMILNAQNGISVVASASNGSEAVKQAREKKPDVILMDIRMPEINGIECLKIIKSHRSQIKIIILTTFDDDAYIYDALRNGADGFLLKGTTKGELINSIRIVYNNGVTVDPEIAKKVFALFGRLVKTLPTPTKTNISEDQDINELSKNEIKIIQLIGKGLSNKEITEELHFSEGTVRNYISSILKKLKLRDRTQIAIFAIQSGLLLKEL